MAPAGRAAAPDTAAVPHAAPDQATPAVRPAAATAAATAGRARWPRAAVRHRKAARDVAAAAVANASMRPPRRTRSRVADLAARAAVRSAGCRAPCSAETGARPGTHSQSGAARPTRRCRRFAFTNSTSSPTANAPGIRTQQSGDQIDRRALAATGTAEQRDDAAWRVQRQSRRARSTTQRVAC